MCREVGKNQVCLVQVHIFGQKGIVKITVLKEPAPAFGLTWTMTFPGKSKVGLNPELFAFNE